MNIMFVDDEVHVLEGLRRMLRPFHDKWQMRFAASGAEAIELLRTAPCDIIVSDMRMPGMSGGELLAKVREQYPDTIRFMLSGQADQYELFDHIGTVHQFLQKPCSAETLRSAIARAFRQRDRFSGGGLRSLASSLAAIPSLPANYCDLLTELKCDDASAESVGRIIARDVGMTAKVMQLVNSSFFGSTRKVSTPTEAVSRLGLRTLMTIAVSLHLFEQFPLPSGAGVSLPALWDRACRMADRCRAIAVAARLPAAQCDAAQLAGMLHELGRLVFACNSGKEYGAAVVAGRAAGISLIEAERKQFGIRQGELGGYVLGLWAFAEEVVDAVTFFECPSESAGAAPSTLTALHLAASTNGGSDRACEIDVDQAYLKRIGADALCQTWVKTAAAAAA
jgi:HD-like signal output (HDOD) protein